MKNYILAALFIVAVASCAKKSTPSKTASNDAVSIYTANCAKCHGANGIEGKAAKLNHPMQPEQIVSTITNGHNKMPAFKGKLTDQQIQSVAGLVVQLQNKNKGK